MTAWHWAPWVVVWEDSGVANQPKTPITSVRIPVDLKEAAQVKAAENAETLTDVIRRGLVEYVEQS